MIRRPHPHHALPIHQHGDDALFAGADVARQDLRLVFIGAQQTHAIATHEIDRAIARLINRVNCVGRQALFRGPQAEIRRIVIIEAQQPARGPHEHATQQIYREELVIGIDLQLAAGQRHGVKTGAIEARQAHFAAYPDFAVRIQRQLVHHFSQQPFITPVDGDVGAVKAQQAGLRADPEEAGMVLQEGGYGSGIQPEAVIQVLQAVARMVGQHRFAGLGAADARRQQTHHDSGERFHSPQ